MTRSAIAASFHRRTSMSSLGGTLTIVNEDPQRSPTALLRPRPPPWILGRAEDLAAVFKALADPTRVAIVNRLACDDECCVCDLTAAFAPLAADRLAPPADPPRCRPGRVSSGAALWAYYYVSPDALEEIARWMTVNVPSSTRPPRGGLRNPQLALRGLGTLALRPHTDVELDAGIASDWAELAEEAALPPLLGAPQLADRSPRSASRRSSAGLVLAQDDEEEAAFPLHATRRRGAAHAVLRALLRTRSSAIRPRIAAHVARCP